jgi:hypothetical protein
MSLRLLLAVLPTDQRTVNDRSSGRQRFRQAGST